MDYILFSLLNNQHTYTQKKNTHKHIWRELLQVVTGLLIAEVNVSTMCELGSGGVSLVTLSTGYPFLMLAYIWLVYK